MVENRAHRLRLQIGLPHFKGRVGNNLVAGEQLLVHQLHEGGITNARLLDRLAKRQDIRVKMALVDSGNAVLLARVGDARLGPSFAPGCGSAELGEHPSDLSITVAYGHLPDHVHVLCRGLILDRPDKGLLIDTVV